MNDCGLLSLFESNVRNMFAQQGANNSSLWYGIILGEGIVQGV